MGLNIGKAWRGKHLGKSGRQEEVARKVGAPQPRQGAQGQGREGQSRRRSAGRPTARRCRRDAAMDAGRDRGSVPPLPGRDAGAEGRACSTSIRSRCWSRWCCRRRRPTPASTRRRRRCSPLADTPEKMVALGEDKVRELIKTIGLFRTKAKNVDRAVAEADRRARRRGAAHRARRWRRCPASAARPPTSCSTSRSASRPSRSTRTSSASATAPAWRPARTRSRWS